MNAMRTGKPTLTKMMMSMPPALQFTFLSGSSGRSTARNLDSNPLKCPLTKSPVEGPFRSASSHVEPDLSVSSQQTLPNWLRRMRRDLLERFSEAGWPTLSRLLLIVLSSLPEDRVLHQRSRQGIPGTSAVRSRWPAVAFIQAWEVCLRRCKRRR